jgi:hypothetical protein
VVIIVSDEIEYSAGTDLGRTLRLTNPWGTPEMAENILQSIRGFQYQPYSAEGAHLDPAAELGDGVTVNNVYGGIYTRALKFGPLLTATVAAPEDEEINHEYPYKSKPNKEITREAKLIRASLSVQAARISAEIKDRTAADEEIGSILELQAGQISAKVNKTGGAASSFGWVLDDASWTIKANSRDVLKATKDGLEIYGKITATSGKIGGFDIQSNYLSYNNQAWGGTNSTGIYIGVSGIQLGKNFKVDSGGNLTAYSGKFEGTVQAGNILYGGNNGTLSGSGISSGSISGNRLVSGTVSTTYTSSGINASLGRADSAYNICTGVSTARKMIMQELSATSKASVESLYIGGTSVTKKSITFVDGNKANVTISYWG